MAEVNALVARAEVTTQSGQILVGSRYGGAPNGHQVLAADGLIDAFAEVFAQMAAGSLPSNDGTERFQDKPGNAQSDDGEAVRERASDHPAEDSSESQDLLVRASETSSLVDPLHDFRQLDTGQPIDVSPSLSEEGDIKAAIVVSPGTPVAVTNPQTGDGSEFEFKGDGDSEPGKATSLVATGPLRQVDPNQSQVGSVEPTNQTESAVFQGTTDDRTNAIQQGRSHQHGFSEDGSSQFGPSSRGSVQHGLNDRGASDQPSYVAQEGSFAEFQGDSEPSPTDREVESNVQSDGRKRPDQRLRGQREAHFDTAAANSPNRIGTKTSTPTLPGHADATGGDAATAKGIESIQREITSLPSNATSSQPAATVNQIQGVAAAIGRSGAATTTTTSTSPADGLSLAGGASRVADVGTRRPTAASKPDKSTAEMMARIKLIQRVSKAFHHLGNQGGSIRLRLAPAELGTVRIEMQVQQRQVNARVVAETEAASAALREHLPELRARLESYGMQVERLDVETEAADRGFESGQDAQSRWQSSQHQWRPEQRFRIPLSQSSSNGSDTLDLPVTGSASPPLPGSGVDVRL